MKVEKYVYNEVLMISKFILTIKIFFDLFKFKCIF